jgi:hypothetical protein
MHQRAATQPEPTSRNPPAGTHQPEPTSQNPPARTHQEVADMSGSHETLTLFDFDDALPLAGTDMMSMPTLTDPTVDPESFMAWVGSSGHVVKVLYRGEGDDGLSLVDVAREHGQAWAQEALAHQ